MILRKFNVIVSDCCGAEVQMAKQGNLIYFCSKCLKEVTPDKTKSITTTPDEDIAEALKTVKEKVREILNDSITIEYTHWDGGQYYGEHIEGINEAIEQINNSIAEQLNINLNDTTAKT